MLKIEGLPNEPIPVGDMVDVAVHDDKTGEQCIKVDWEYGDHVAVVEQQLDEKYVYTICGMSDGTARLTARARNSSITFFVEVFEWRHRIIE